MKTLRKKTHWLMFASEGVGKIVDAFIITLIAINVMLVVWETEPGARDVYGGFFDGFDVFSSIFFTIEYVIRLWACVEDPRYQRAMLGRIRYSGTPMAVVDLLAILPFWLPMIIDMDLRFVRALRLFRLFRLFKIGRYAHAIGALARVFTRKREQLSMTFFTVTMMLVLFSSLMFFVESEAVLPNGEVNKFTSIAQTMWWTVATLTTVGYGDMYPITGLGQFLGGIISFMGVIIIALPAGIVASGFAEEMSEKLAAQKLAAEAKAKAAADEQRVRRASEHAMRAVGDDPVPGALPCPHCGGHIALTLDAAPSGDRP